MKIINFAHPLTESQLQEIKALSGGEISAVLEIPSQICPEMPLTPQIEKMIVGINLSPRAWQTEPLLINLPTLNFSAAALLAQLHGRMGYFPPVICLRPVAASMPPRFEVAEILNLQEMRQRAREER